jgi:protein kinase-like protein
MVTPGPLSTQELKVVEATIERLENLVGQRFSRFVVERIIAQGASGVVFRAVDVRTRRTFALKVLWPDICRKEKEVKRFVRAIRAMCRIQHPNLIRLYAAGRSQGLCRMIATAHRRT